VRAPDKAHQLPEGPCSRNRPGPGRGPEPGRLSEETPGTGNSRIPSDPLQALPHDLPGIGQRHIFPGYCRRPKRHAGTVAATPFGGVGDILVGLNGKKMIPDRTMTTH